MPIRSQDGNRVALGRGARSTLREVLDSQEGNWLFFFFLGVRFQRTDSC